MSRSKRTAKKNVAKLRLTLFGAALIVFGLLLATYSYGTLVFLRGQLADKNLDGIVNWHDADVNSDNFVDAADLYLVALNQGVVNATNVRCDLNNDGVVDEADVAIVSVYYGAGTLSLMGALTNTGSVYGQEFLLGIGLFFGGLGTMAYSRFFFKRRR